LRHPRAISPEEEERQRERSFFPKIELKALLPYVEERTRVFKANTFWGRPKQQVAGIFTHQSFSMHRKISGAGLTHRRWS